MVLDPEMAWRRLRSLRADPPGFATGGERRRTFTAALEQSEQLWQASRSLDHATLPIVLYYCLVQGCQAALAARAAGNNEWQARPSHGLRLEEQITADVIPTLADFAVRDFGDGFFQQIAGLNRSASLANDPATLAALVNSLPGAEAFVGEGAGQPFPLFLVMRGPAIPLTAYANQNDIACIADVSPVPQSVIAAHPVESYGGTGSPIEPEVLATLHAWLASYPSLSGKNAPVHSFSVSAGWGETPSQAILGWRWGPTPKLDEFESGDDESSWRATQFRRLVDFPMNGEWGDLPMGFAIPGVGGNARSMSPLSTWAAILYAMSMTARYQSSQWTRVLDANRSRESERVRHVLDTAVEEVPAHLLLAMRDGEAVQN